MSENVPLDRRSFLKTAVAAGLITGSGLLGACTQASPAPVTSTEQPQPTEEPKVTGDALERILNEKKINVAVVIYPPDTFKEGNDLKGTFIEVTNWLGKQMSVDVNYVEAEFGTFIAALQSGRADVAVAPTFATVARGIAVDFTNTIYYLGYSALVRKEEVDRFSSIEAGDQDGVTYVEREGTPVHKWCTENLKTAKLISLAANADPTQMALEVMSGRANIYIEDDWLVKKLVAEHSDALAEMPAYSTKPWMLNRVAWGVAKGQPSLLNLMNVAIDYLLANNQIQKWQLQYGGHGLYKTETFYSPLTDG